MPDSIDILFSELVKEFLKVKPAITDEPRLRMNLRTGSINERGTTRYDVSKRSMTAESFSTNSIIQFLKYAIRDFRSVKKIYEKAVEENWIPLKEVDAFEKDLLKFPSITQNIAAGFLARNFELNDYKLIITSSSFERAISELKSFIAKGTFDWTSILSLHGPHGDVPGIELAKGINIEMADYETAKLFGLHYSAIDGHYNAMYERDYVLAMQCSLDKKDWRKMEEMERELIKKWFNVPLLARTGNMEKGVVIRTSHDWPLLTIQAPHSFYYHPNLYDSHNKSKYEINEATIDNFKEAASVFKDVDFKKLDAKIQHALERVKKAKATKNPEDRVIELALALEYLLNYSSSDGTLQLRIKAAKLLHDAGDVKATFDTMKDFNTLRGKIMHSSTKQDRHDEKTIDAAEVIIAAIIVRIVKLCKTYTFPRVRDALHESMFRPEPLEEILKPKNN